MRTVICIAIILSTTVFGLSSPVSAQVGSSSFFASGTVLLTDEEQAWLKARSGVIRFAPDPAFPPLEWFDEQGGYRGFVADCFRLIETRLGARFEIVRCATWDEVLQKAKRREVDGITAAQITPGRQAYLSFTRPLADIPNVIITRHDQQGVLEFGLMKEMSIAITSGNALHEYLRTGFPELRLVPYPDDLSCLHAVSFGRADATVINVAIAAWLIEKHGIVNLRVAGDSGKKNQLAIACRNDEPLMLTIMEKGLSSLTDQERQEIFGRWIRLEDGAGVSREYFWRILGYAAMLLTAVLTAFFVWNRALQAQVALRTDELQAELTAKREIEKALRDEKERLAVTLASIGEGVIT
ncbi:MAG TPA: transporter substrate-binding domain-containing protein, partial [Candidatus Ozemobacteraceae bacterium]|nr:transporter substrate-binding domain-containing protein [Candidatus Ozemobacteraceae bacterium]